LMSIRGTQFRQLGIWMESVCLRLSKGYNLGQVDPFGFSWPLLVSLRDPRPELWILLDP
jgi:hypothetical protein